MSITGRCLCGEVTYSLAIDNLPCSYACHCHQCQRQSGSAFNQYAVVSADAVTIHGRVNTYEVAKDDWILTRRACAVCRSGIYTVNSYRPDLVLIRAGTLDRSEELNCVAHIFTNYRQRWLELPDDAPSWPEGPEQEPFIALLSGS